MRKYKEIAKMFFKTQLIWRFDVIFNMLFTVIKILFAYILWGAIFGERDMVSNFTFHAMLSYYIISSFLSQIEMSDNVSNEISSKIRNGTFSKYMVIPVNIERYFIAQSAGNVCFYLFFDFVAALVWIFVFKINFVFTSDIYMIIMAVILVIQGLIFMIQLNYFLGILTLKFQDIKIFLMIKNNLVAFITGTLVPLALLPESIVRLMRFFPFYYVTYLPSMLLIGKNQEEALTGVITLAVWMAFFIVINRLFYNTLRIKYDGVGI